MHDLAPADLRGLRAPRSKNRRWRKYRPLLGLALLASGVLGYWAVTERPSSPQSRGGPRQLIPDRCLPDSQRRLLDEITIELVAPGSAPSEFSLQRRRSGGQAGFYLAPAGQRADDAEVESLLSALLSAVVERSLAPTQRPDDFYRAYGVSAEQCRVRVRFGPGHALCFGADSPSGAVYVRADYAAELLVVERTLFELLRRPQDHYRARRLVPEPLGNAHKLDFGPLHLVHEGDLWRVQREDGGWSLAEPARVEELVQRMTAWPVVSFPAAAPSGEAPPLRLFVDGAERLRGGWPCPQTAAPEVRLFVRGDGEAVCAEAPAARRLLPGWTELRAQSLLAVPSAQVTRLQVAATVDVVRQPEGTYTQSGEPADTESVRHTLAVLTESRALTPVNRIVSPSTALRIVAATALGQRITLKLWTDGGRTLVQRDDEPAQLLDESAAELLALTPASFRPRQILAIAPATVQRIRRQGPTAEVLERAAGWHLQEPTIAPASSTAVESLLAALSDLRAERWVSLSPPAERALEPPRFRLTISLGGAGSAGKKESDSQAGGVAESEPGLEVFAAVGARGDCYARRRAGAPLAVLSAATCATLAQPLLGPLLLRIDEDRLSALTFTAGRESADSRSCMRREGHWQCGEHPLSPAAQRALFTALHALQTGERPNYAPVPAPPPRWTLRLTHTPLTAAPYRPLAPAIELGEEVAPPEQTLRLYPAKEGGVAAWLDQRGVSYHLPDAVMTALQAALASAAP